MRKLTLLFLALLVAYCVSAQENVRLTVSGQGTTKEEATANALRSAIEQAYGVFVSANTTILNDELVKDEIATVASGNIEKFQEISYTTTPSGDSFITLSATVAISKLQAYAKSKGSSAEFAGATFAMNMKMRELNKQNEEKALWNMFDQLQELAPYVFNWNLEVGDPLVLDKYYKTPITVAAEANDASTAFYDMFINTLKALSLTPIEVEEYKRSGINTYMVRIKHCTLIGNAYDQDTPVELEIILRNNPYDFLSYFGYLVDCIGSSFRIKILSVTGQTYSPKTDIENLNLFAIKENKYTNTITINITDFRRYKKNIRQRQQLTAFARQANALVPQEDMMYLQGFEVEHSLVNRTIFKHNDGEIKASGITIYQDIKEDEFWVDNYTCGLWDKLDEITICEGVSIINDHAFCGQRITNINLPNSITEIGNAAFVDCKQLTRITIPENVHSIGRKALNNIKEVYCKPTLPPAIHYDTFHQYGGITIYVPTECVEVYKSAWSHLSDYIVGYDFQ